MSDWTFIDGKLFWAIMWNEIRQVIVSGIWIVDLLPLMTSLNILRHSLILVHNLIRLVYHLVRCWLTFIFHGLIISDDLCLVIGLKSGGDTLLRWILN